MKRFHYCRDPLFLIGCALYALNRWEFKPHTHSAFLHNYFNDLWLIPCALPVVLWVQRLLGWRTTDAPPKSAEVFGHFAVWSVVCEIVGPHFLRSTGDPLDIVAYGVGAVFAWAWWQRETLTIPSR